jgi:hypothetical protein
MKVTVADGETAHCYVFGTMAGCLDGGAAPRTARWVPIPDGSHVGNVYTFDLPADAQTRIGGGGAIDSWIDKVHEAKMRSIVNKARADISAALVQLPEPLRTTATSAYNGDMAPTIAESSETEGSFYTGFGWYFSSRVCPYIGYRATVSDTIIAHETGHYLNHLLARNANFRTIIDLAPDENHGVGTLYADRQTITEEYAYYQQFLISDSVNGSDPASGFWLGNLTRKTPAQWDYPSIEGFGCSLMAAMTRPTADPMFDFTAKKPKVPTPAGGLTKGEVLAVYAAGASKIDGLANALELRMKEKGQGEAFRVIAERLGWSYRATGHILNDRLPMSGVTVQPIVKVTVNGVTTTYSTSAVKTDIIGSYTLPRVFFGNGILRITYGGVTSDVPYSIDRTKSTIQYQTIPDIDIANRPDLLLTSITPSIGAMPDDTVTITGANFGTTQPSLGTVLFSPGYSRQRIEPEIVHWSDTAITVTVPFGLDMPSQVNVSRDGSNYSKTPLWFYPGNGSKYLNALKACTSIHVGNIGDTYSWFANKWGLSTGEIVVIRNYPVSPWSNIVSNIQWNGNTFTGTMHGSGYWLVPDVVDIGMASQTVTITGTVDPIRRCLLSMKADLRQMAAGNADAGFDSFDLTLSVSMKNLYGSDEANGIIPFGEGGGNWGTAGYPSTFPTKEDNVVAFFNQLNGSEPNTVFPQPFVGRIYVYFGHE